MLTFNSGRPGDAAVVGDLIVATSPELFAYFCAGDLGLWRELSACEWRTDHGVYSHSLSRLAYHGEQLVGLLIGYSAERKATLDWSFAASRASLAPDRWAVIAANMQLAGFLSPLLPDDAWYLQNIVVSPVARGAGLSVGAHLLESALEQAHAAGCASVHLDVEGSNPAVSFYRRHGFEVLVRTEVPGLNCVGPYLRMMRAL